MRVSTYRYDPRVEKVGVSVSYPIFLTSETFPWLMELRRDIVKGEVRRCFSDGGNPPPQ